MYLKRTENRTAFFLAAEMLLCICICFYGLRRIFGFSFFPDEFGYWAPAAQRLGWDWSEICSVGSYYSFGYSLILTPILFFFKDSVMAYRAAVLVNAGLMCAGLWMLYRILKEAIEERSGRDAVFIAGIAVIYPTWIFYTQTTLSEGLLFFTYLLCCYLFWRLLRNFRLITALGLSAAFVYLYYVHMRCVGVLAVGAGMFLFLFFSRDGKKEKREILLALAEFVLLFLAGAWIKQYLMETLYAGSSAEMLRMNDYAGHMGKFRYLLTLDGMRDFLLGWIGKLLYLTLATAGLAARGLVYSGSRSARLIRRMFRGEGEDGDLFWLFVFLSSMAQLFVAVVYTLGGVREENDRFDMFVHGRYDEFVFPILIAAGLYQMIGEKRGRRLWTQGLLLTCCTGVFSVIAAHIAQKLSLTQVNGYFIPSLSYLIEDAAFVPESFLLRTWVLGSIMIFFYILIVCCYRKFAYAKCFLAILLAVQILGGIHVCEHYVYTGNTYAYLDLRMAQELQEILQKESLNGTDGTGKVICIYEGELPYISRIQFRLRELRIEILDVAKREAKAEELRAEDKVLVDCDSRWNEILREKYNSSQTEGHFSLYYNEPSLESGKDDRS